MFVSRTMTRKVITIDQEASIFDAQELLAKYKIRHLPIIDTDRRLIGIITDRDIRSALPYKSLLEPGNEKERVLEFKVKDIMPACKTKCQFCEIGYKSKPRIA